MAEEKEPEDKQNFWTKLPSGLRKYIFFSILVGTLMAYANYTGWFPTYGIFSGENSMHSSYHSGHYYGGYGIHGK